MRTRRSPTSYVKPRDRVSSRAPGGRSCVSPRASRAERIILTGGRIDDGYTLGMIGTAPKLVSFI